MMPRISRIFPSILKGIQVHRITHSRKHDGGKQQQSQIPRLPLSQNTIQASEADRGASSAATLIFAMSEAAARRHK